MYGRGISREGSVIDLGVDLGIVKKSGAWYTYEGEQLGQGRENSKKFLTDNPEVMVEISDRIWREVMPEETVETGPVEAGGPVNEIDAFDEADDLPISLED